ncbi:MAG: carboxypeptidase-like regulatory domain-containing protein [Candidatus Saganbacteria bacterium]|nr:carboxypeptidase-like regulatory domain-containing protein [Candidatus Saganbacteria bacterium]
MKRTINLAIILVSISFITATLTGCGSGAKESGVPSGTNKGTITGHVYDASTYDNSTSSISRLSSKLIKTKPNSIFSKSKLLSISKLLSRLISPSSRILSYSGTPEVTVMVGNIVATTDANGAYTITGLPSGTVAITAFKDSYQTTTLVVNSDTVNFVLSPQAEYGPPEGTATITGTIEALPEEIYPSTDDDMYLSANSISQYSENSSYDPDSHIYNISNAPDNGQTYVIASYCPENYYNQDVYGAYGRIDMTGGGTKYLNLDFTSVTAISGSVTTPSNFSPAFLSSYLFNQDNNIGYLAGYNFDYSSNDYLITNPQLLSGDSYFLWVLCLDPDWNCLGQEVYNFTGTSKNFDLSSLKVPSIKDPSPADGADLNGDLPTFAWNSAGSNKIYRVVVYEPYEPWRDIWECYTKNTNITIPSNIIGSGTMSPDVEYCWNVSATSYDNFNINDMTSLRNARINSFSGNIGRTFTF